MRVLTQVLGLAIGAYAVSFQIDAGQTQGHLARLWDAGMGSGHATLTLREDWRQAAAEASNKAGIKAIRHHGILDDDMSSFLKGKANMINVFKEYDWLLANGLSPLVELSFMPEDLASDARSTVFHYKGGISPPANWTAFDAFITEFVQALVDRYGISTVSQWHIECWNEPNCGFYDEGNCCGSTCGNKTAYFELYGHMAAAVKKVSPQLQFGGPATAQTGWIDDMIAFANSSSTKVLDFISTHLYPTDPQVPKVRDGWAQTIGVAADKAKSAGYKLLVDEFNAGLGIQVLDESYAAAFLGHVALEAQSLATRGVEMLSYWCVSDVFEEPGMDSDEFHDGFGIRTVNGIAKPVARAFELLTQLQDSLVQVSSSDANAVSKLGGATSGTVDILATANSSATQVVAALSNWMPKGQSPAQTEQITITITNVPVPNPTATLYPISPSSPNPKAVWQKQNSPTYPTPAQLEAMKNASTVISQSLPVKTVGEDIFEVTFSMDPDTFALLVFSS